MKRKYKSLINILLILSFTFIISKYCIQITLVQGKSMSPTLEANSLTVINKCAKTFQDGDIIVFYSSNARAICIKRIIASANESVQIKNGLIYVNNILSPFQRPSTYIDYSGNASVELLLEDNQYFVIGDNYNNSIDSRYPEIGIISNKDIIGKVIFPSTKIK